MNAGLFLGRFHPLIVHLPIGFLLLAVFFEIYVRKTNNKKLDPAISFAMFLGFISGFISVILGFLISSEGGYDDQLLNWHRFSGIGVSVLSFFCWLIKSGNIRIPDLTYLLLTGLLVISLIATGHFGGMLTHGNDYLISNAPEFIRNALRNENKNPVYELPSIPDSLIIYTHLIQPIFDNNCNQCHNPSKRKSGLILNTFDNLMKGGENGIVIEPGHPFQSELFKRVTLPQSNFKFMPPKGIPLTYGEIQILQWWIEEGASKSARLTSHKISENIKHILNSEFAYDTSPKSFVEIHRVTEPEKDNLILLEKNNFTPGFLSKNSSFLDIRYNSESIEIKNLEAMQTVSEQITWLDLRNSGITDEMLILIGNLPNLTKLRLDGNPVTEKGIAYLEGLKHLEMISLYNTEVGKGCLRSLIKLPSLRKLYLGKTSIVKEDIAEIEKIRTDLEVILDLYFSESTESFQ